MVDYKKTLIAVILDESGSMQTKRADVIGGFNTFLLEQKALPDPCRMSVTKFNTKTWTTTLVAPIGRVSELSAQSYTPGGNTALLDAIATTVKEIDAQKAGDERVLVLVITDGEENSSVETTKEQVKAIVAEHEKRGDWTFTYLGPSPEKWADIGVTSFAANNASYDPKNPRASFSMMTASVSAYRRGATGQSTAFYGTPTPAPEKDDATWKKPHQ